MCQHSTMALREQTEYNHAMPRMSLKVGNLKVGMDDLSLRLRAVVIGAKCWMISHYASPTPYWDQWDAEGAFLYPKYFDGTLSFSDLIAPHNEHRVLVSRLWSLLLLELGGYWDPMLQMVANTLIFGAAVALFVAAFRPVLDRRSWLVFALFSMVIFSLPVQLGKIRSRDFTQRCTSYCYSPFPALSLLCDAEPSHRAGGWRRCC